MMKKIGNKIKISFLVKVNFIFLRLKAKTERDYYIKEIYRKLSKFYIAEGNILPVLYIIIISKNR